MSAKTPGPGWSVNTKQDWLIAAVIVALVLFFVVWPHPTATKAAHRTPTDLWHVKVNDAALQFGCRSKAELHRITCCSAEGDQRASMRLFWFDMDSGACRSFRPGEPVFASDTEPFAGLVRVRRTVVPTDSPANAHTVRSRPPRVPAVPEGTLSRHVDLRRTGQTHHRASVGTAVGRSWGIAVPGGARRPGHYSATQSTGRIFRTSRV